MQRMGARGDSEGAFMKKVLTWILFATPLFYVGLMKATGQPVEVAVVFMLVPFIAAPFLLSRFVPKDEEQAKAQAIQVITMALTGEVVDARPSKVPKKEEAPGKSLRSRP
jgi:hypothetical protein